MNTTKVEFVPDDAIPERTDARTFVRALQAHPNRWAKVPETLPTPRLRQLKTYGSIFGFLIELRIVKPEAPEGTSGPRDRAPRGPSKGSPERWARIVTKAHEHAARRSGSI